jgi:ELWxxDGT repeat protein
MKSPALRHSVAVLCASLGLLIITAGLPALAAPAPHLVRNINGVRSSTPRHLTVVGDRLFFTAKDRQHGRELWVSDGTQSGTRRVGDIVPGSAGSGPAELTAVGDRLLFIANDRIHGRELWVSDGTTAGTRMVKDLTHGSASSGIGAITDVGGTAFFFKEDHDVELWTSDGTKAGTQFVVDVDPTSPEYPDGIESGFSFGGHFFFSADDPVNGFTLRISDGTADGTRIVPGGNDGAALFTPVGDTLFFTAGDDHFGGKGQELWETDADGTAATFVATLNGAYEMVAFKNKAYFTNDYLGKSNGTPQGTKWLDAGGFNLQPVGGTLFYAGGLDSHGETPDGVELWATDGTAHGTHMVKDINPHGHDDLSSSLPSYLTDLDGTLFFTATRRLDRYGPSYAELWTSDGTEAGTRQVANLHAEGGSSPTDLIAMGHSLFFTVDDGVHGRELWVYTP